MNFIQSIKSVLHLLRIDLVKYPNKDLRRRISLLNFYTINKILDVGANSGQYALETFKLGFSGQIISFEPLKAAFNDLEGLSKKKKNWSAIHCGLGDQNEERDINVSANSFSSSLLAINDNHLKNAPDSKFVRKERVNLKRLDDIYDDVVTNDDKVLLKIDAQGYEKQILDGAKNSLEKIQGVQLEMSLEELYHNEVLFKEMLHYLNQRGFNLCSLENGFYNNKSGKLLQVDGIFFKE